MNFKKKISRIIFGNIFPQEYLCLSGLLKDPLSVILVSKNLSPRDVTFIHLLLGYKPLIIGILADRANEELKQVFLSGEPVFLQCNSEGQGMVADIKLEIAGSEELGRFTLYLFRGINSKHNFLPFHQKIANNLRYMVRQFKAGNVSLPGNLYDQVRIAYAIPRNIRIITVGNGNLYNIFPTDLHGPVGNDHYVISLRVGGKAGAQVMKAGKIVISIVKPGFFKEAYSLGKNHMQELKPIESFPVSGERSENLGLPLPMTVTRYIELEQNGTCIHGIHQLYFFRVLNQRVVGQAEAELTHIHSYYANWRSRNGLETDVLLR